jgi:hypothetical protein
MTDAQKEFVRLAAKYEAIKDELDDTREKLQSVMKEVGLDTYTQDPNTLLVYKIHKPNGTFMYYRDIDFKRTAKEGEKGGTVLSKKEAEEAGFTLKRS